MPAYSFEAVTQDGQERKGVLQADTAKTARAQLRSQGLVPLAVSVVGNTQGGRGGGFEASGSAARAGRKRVFDAVALATWARSLGGLVAAGLPLERALRSLADESELEPQRNLLANLRSEVNGGSSLANALAQHPRDFADVLVAAVAAGEASGNLGVVLEMLADDMEQAQALQSKLLGAALYPAIVTLVAVVIVTFLLAYVVPQVANVFAGSKRALPLLTIIMLGLANFVRQWGWVVLLVFAGLGAAFWAMRNNAAWRLRLDHFWLQIPVLGPLSRGFNASRFASTLALLSGSGVPMLKALQAAGQTLSNRAMREEALQLVVLVREGAPLALALAQQRSLPPVLSTFAGLGEQTGQLPAMLGRAAKQISDQVQRRSLYLATVAEPLLIVAMGLVVTLIVLAVLLPIIQLNQLVK